VHYKFDTMSERTELDYGNGAVLLYTYAPNSLLQSMQHNFGAGASVTFTNFRNTENGVKAATITDSTYGPSTSNPELTVATHTYTPNTLNQYASIDSTSYTYDTNGNLTWDGVYTYKYDPQNRLVSTTKSGTTIIYAYDPISRRLTKSVNGVTANYLSAGSQEIAEYDGSGNLVRRYVYGPGIDGPVVRIEIAGSHYYHHTDTLGSVIALTDSTDTVTEKHPHTIYGVGDTTTGSAYQFTGQRIDNASGDTSLYYLRARMYSPTIGRFLSPDPSGATAGLNIYAYVGNDPINNTDASGLISAGTYSSIGAEAGVWPTLGAGGTFSTSSGIFYNTPSWNPSTWGPGLTKGNFNTEGGFAQFDGGSYTTSSPISNFPSGVLGASIGAMRGFWISNADNSIDLLNTFTTYTLNIAVFQIQWAFGNGTGVLALGAGPSLGFSFSSFPTTTTFQSSIDTNVFSAIAGSDFASNGPLSSSDFSSHDYSFFDHAFLNSETDLTNNTID